MKRAKKKIAKPAKRKVAAKKAAKKKQIARPAIVGKRAAPGNGAGVVTWNFKLLSHHYLDGFGGMGEGMSIQIAPDGRRILWLAHESAPKNFTAVDV
ncbi:MAG TPA: hypothetical protein VNL39_14680, partial [Xanthobacteraceae bacterium]|nr:hypothetical protein [Xanthobacteraceae bacterium]